MQIREADLTDTEALLTLWVEFTNYLSSIESDFFQLRSNAREIFRDILIDQIKNEKTLIFIVEDNILPIGYEIVTIRYPGKVFLQEPYGHISDLYLREGYRGRNLGLQMVQMSLNWLKEHKVSRVTVNPFLVNTKVLGFWDRLGFRGYKMGLKYIID